MQQPEVHDMSCQEVMELLPWWSNGSLQKQDQTRVDRHLGQCEACRTELSQVNETAWLFSQHIPTEKLIAHAEELRLEPEENTIIEFHLQRCETCQMEHQIVAADLLGASCSVESIDRIRLSKHQTHLKDERHPHWTSRLSHLDWLPAAACLALAVLWTSTDQARVVRPPETGAEEEQPVEQAARREEVIFRLELTTPGAVPLMADGRAVLDGIFLDGFESPKSLDWSEISDDSRRDVERSQDELDPSNQMNSTSKET